MIKIIALGKIKEQYLKDMIIDYQKRICKYYKLEIIELKDTNNLSEEAELIKKQINRNDYIVTLEIDGQQLSSEAFAKFVDQTFITNSNITFIIGSSNGLDPAIKKIANYHLSFSTMTFPHGLFRAILLEQIYRSCKINNNETYHK